jgi:hypothetical protein
MGIIVALGMDAFQVEVFLFCFFFWDWAIMIGWTQKRKPITLWKLPNTKISILDAL